MFRINGILAGIFFLLGLFAFFYSFQFSEVAAFWPKFFAVVLMALAIALIVDTKLKPDREQVSENTISTREYKLLAIIAASTVIYMIALDLLGFTVSSIVLLFILFWIFGYRQLKNALIISIASSVVVTVIFQVLLNVPLPQGLFENFY
ncbi:tripartite tricarboxylate transporter TctB family protein [Sporosarcina highlanderae]|uniref:Tripartite tricarboxylate transporter TctB family protein n=1 Tax=Sporosarcina highlanderae TaxID=3035916 RepID=A0ABT8JLR1_9BACL|nr:tripartite tricarboxylate transporter TctB family protein [Sporosarcina highlanderae]MDN4605872.1 tripartite tricarboxylate transporter TctB family protein [Sporosarcina highlanderae]